MEVTTAFVLMLKVKHKRQIFLSVPWVTSSYPWRIDVTVLRGDISVERLEKHCLELVVTNVMKIVRFSLFGLCHESNFVF